MALCSPGLTGDEGILPFSYRYCSANSCGTISGGLGCPLFSPFFSRCLLSSVDCFSSANTRFLNRIASVLNGARGKARSRSERAACKCLQKK